MTNIMLGKHVSVSEDCSEHIKKHDLSININDIISLADNQTNGKEGIHECISEGNMLTIVVRGIHEESGNSYGIVRTIWNGNSKGADRRGLSIIRHHSIKEQRPKKITNHCPHAGIIPYVSRGDCLYCK